MLEQLAESVEEGFAPYLQAAREGAGPAAVFERFNQFRVLTALRQGPFGVEALNRLCEVALRDRGLIQTRQDWYLGRPVMIVRNDYNLRLFNGDIGITLPDPDEPEWMRVFFLGSDGALRSFAPARLPEHETVYAMTMHKSQGSEFNRVWVVLQFCKTFEKVRVLEFPRRRICMADNCRYVTIHFGTRFDEKWDLSLWRLLKGEEIIKTTIETTGSLWDFSYGKNSDLSKKYSGQTDPIPGPDCAFTPFARGCFAAPTGTDGPEGKSPYDFITLKPGVDQFLYLDIGLWGSNKRDFGLVCGPHAWLCSYGAGGGTPTPETFHEQHLCNFHREMGNFKVLSNGTVKLHKDDFNSLALKIYVLLPDMHMWPDPVELSKNRRKFFNPSETAALEQAVAEGKLIFYSPDGSYRLPDLPPGQIETPFQREVRLLSAGGWAAKKEEHMADVAQMQREEREHAFGSTAGRDLEQFLNALEKVRAKGYEIQVVQAGDLLELWAPVSNMLDENPFSDTQWLSFTQTTRKRLPLCLDLIYNNIHNRRALEALERAKCFHVFGNHDVYLALDWELGKSSLMNKLMGSWGYFCENLLWVEHGQRFQPSNRDGYWLWKAVQTPEPGTLHISGTIGDLMTPPGPMVTTAVNYYPGLRKLADTFDNPEENLYKKNVPYASIWYILAKQKWVKWKNNPLFWKPDKFRIFVQGHTHSATLLKIYVNFAEKKKKRAGAGG